jgi:hypothetical protein
VNDSYCSHDMFIWQTFILRRTCHMLVCLLWRRSHYSWTWPFDVPNDTHCPVTSHWFACQQTSRGNATTILHATSKNNIDYCVTFNNSRWKTDKWPITVQVCHSHDLSNIPNDKFIKYVISVVGTRPMISVNTILPPKHRSPKFRLLLRSAGGLTQEWRTELDKYDKICTKHCAQSKFSRTTVTSTAQGLSFSRRWLWKWLPYETWCSTVWYKCIEKLVASISGVK